MGEGELDLVWVPNWLSNVDMGREEPSFARFLDRLASFARLIVFDRRGSGASDPVVGAPTLEERMDDIRAVMDAVGSRSAALFGFSEGGPMAALFAASYPERVQSLLLYGAYARGLATPEYPWAPARRGCGSFRISQRGRGQHDASPFESWSATMTSPWPRRADRAPGLGLAGEEPAYRRNLPGLFDFLLFPNE